MKLKEVAGKTHKIVNACKLRQRQKRVPIDVVYYILSTAQKIIAADSGTPDALRLLRRYKRLAAEAGKEKA